MASLVAEVQWVEIGIHFAEMCGPCNKWSVCGKQVKDVCTHMMLWVHTSVQDTAPRVLACNSSCLCSIINWSPQALLSFQPGWVLLACVTVNAMAGFTLAIHWPSILPVCTSPFVTDLPSRRSFCVFLWLQPSSTPLSESEAVDLIKDTFASAAERDIYTVCSHFAYVSCYPLEV